MVSSSAKSVADYLNELPPERREVVAALRQRILKHLPKGYEEMMLWGMLVYVVPLKHYPNTYNGQPLAYAALAAQKNAYSLYLNVAYGDNAIDRAFRQAFAEAGKKLDMGKSCVRFKKLEDLVLEAVDQVIASTPVEAFLAGHEQVRAATKTGQRDAATSKKAAAKTVAASKAVSKAASKKPAPKSAAAKTGSAQKSAAKKASARKKASSA